MQDVYIIEYIDRTTEKCERYIVALSRVINLTS